MKKKIFAILMAVCLCLITFSGCGSNEEPAHEDDSSYAETQSETDIESDYAETYSEDESSSTASQEEVKADIEWKTFSYTVKDANGYKFTTTYKVSPFIFMSDTNKAMADAIWNEIGKGNEMPEDFSDWELKKQSNSLYRRESLWKGSLYGYDPYAVTMTDMYYCFGTVDINNATSGWSVSQENKRSIPITLETEFIEDSLISNTIQSFLGIGRLFFTGESSDSFQGLQGTNASLVSNNWGPAPFVIMMPENFSPAYPNGQYAEELKTNIRFNTFNMLIASEGATKFTVGVIDKNGIYTPPVAMD